MSATIHTSETDHAAPASNGVKQYIVSTKDTCNGQPRVSGTRIRVWDIYWWYERDGRSIDQIVADFPQLTHAEVHAALSYYWEHRTELHQHDDKMNKLLDEYIKAHPSKLQAKLEKLYGTEPQVSS